MLQLSEEIAYLHQAFAFCQDMRARLAASLVCYASSRMPSQMQRPYTGCAGCQCHCTLTAIVQSVLQQVAAAAMQVLRCNALFLLATEVACCSQDCR